MYEFKAWEDLQSSLQNHLETEESISTEKEKNWMNHMLALAEAETDVGFW